MYDVTGVELLHQLCDVYDITVVELTTPTVWNVYEVNSTILPAQGLEYHSANVCLKQPLYSV